MHAAVKVIVGLVLVLVGLALFIDSVYPLSGGKGTTIERYTINWLDNFLIVLTGIIPIALILIGLFVVWLEADELKAGSQLGTQQAKETAAKTEDKPADRKK